MRHAKYKSAVLVCTLAMAQPAVAGTPPHIWPAKAWRPVAHHAIKLRVRGNQTGAASSQVRVHRGDLIQIERIVVNSHSLVFGNTLRNGDSIMYGAGAAVRVSAPDGGVVSVTVASVRRRAVRVVVRFHRAR